MADSTTQATASPQAPTSPTQVAASSKAPTSPNAPTSPKSVASPTSAASPHSAPGAAGDEEDVLEVDHGDNEEFDERLSTYTASLSSSVLDYPVENGRRYHAYRKGTYMFPNDDREAERLDVIHHMIVRTIKGNIYLAPIDVDNVQNILDIGTGTGTLAVELADAIPNAEVIGCDLSPTQTPWVPPNLKFEVDDVESDWTYPFKFDFIMCRYMTASIRDWPKLVERIYDNLTPGGWVELQDWDFWYVSDDDTLTDAHYMRQFNSAFIAGTEKIGRDSRPGYKLRSFAERAGFTNIREERFKVPLGPWPKDPVLKQTGMMNLVQMLDGLEAFALKIFELLGWSRVETEVFLASVRKELKEGKSHSYAYLYVVYAQKP